MDREFSMNNEGSGTRRPGGRRPVTDYGSTMLRWMHGRRSTMKNLASLEIERPSQSYVVNLLPPIARPQSPADTVPTRHVHSSLNKIKHPVNIVRWTPEGRRLLTGSSSGEFTLWNGTAFNFETIMQAHDSAIRAAAYTHGEDWLISADQDGVIKYWQTNFNNVKAFQAHQDPIRDLAFAPNDSKFITACDDATLQIFDFAGGIPESSLTGHSWDAKTVDWHPTKGLIVSGSKDHQVKLWDPRSGRCLTTLHGHKNTIAKVAFEPRKGHLLATCARDQTPRIFDLRMMRDVNLLRGHEKDVSTLVWHPFHSSLLSTGGSDGSIFHYLLDEPHNLPGTAPMLSPYDSQEPHSSAAPVTHPAHRIPFAHDFSVWSLDWHPLGHILASGSNDRVSRFWTRARPGETDYCRDRYHLGDAAVDSLGSNERRNGRRTNREEEEQEVEDEAEGLIDQEMPSAQTTVPGIPGLSALSNRVNTKKTSDPSKPRIFTPEQIATLIAQGKIPAPPLPNESGLIIVPPPPLPAGFDFTPFQPGSVPLPPSLLSAGKLPPLLTDFNGPSLQDGVLASHAASTELPGLAAECRGNMLGGIGSTIRRRAPLPSQAESLMEEQRKGKYRHAR